MEAGIRQWQIEVRAQVAEASAGMTSHDPHDPLAPWRAWIGRTEQRTDLVTAAPLAALAALLDRDEPEPLPGTDIPPLAHWLYGQTLPRQSELDAEGRSTSGRFLPASALGSCDRARVRVDFLQPLRVGDEIVRTSRVTQMTDADAARGTPAHVSVRHEIANAQGLAITETHDLIQAEEGAGETPTPPDRPDPLGAAFSRTVDPTPSLLFRFSALTFDAHRVHYDRAASRMGAQQPGLMVHAPLLALLLVDLLRRERPRARLRRLDFEVLQPTYDTQPIVLSGRDEGRSTFPLWCQDPGGRVTLRAEARTE
jgi:3-methylfumaryl-CoA hydratase